MDDVNTYFHSITAYWLLTFCLFYSCHTNCIDSSTYFKQKILFWFFESYLKRGGSPVVAKRILIVEILIIKCINALTSLLKSSVGKLFGQQRSKMRTKDYTSSWKSVTSCKKRHFNIFIAMTVNSKYQSTTTDNIFCWLEIFLSKLTNTFFSSCVFFSVAKQHLRSFLGRVF